jgi:hypothetical protein
MPEVVAATPIEASLGRWILAHAIGELLGLGAGAAVAGGIILALRMAPASLLGALVALPVLGGIEGSFLGTAQTIALSGTAIPAGPWLRATVAGMAVGRAVQASAFSMASLTVGQISTLAEGTIGGTALGAALSSLAC